MDYVIEIPGNSDVTMEIGDTLRIHYKNSAKFCIDSGNKDAFSQPLPVGKTEPVGWWPGKEVSKATVAISDTTIKYCHADPKEGCKPCKATENGPGTIKIGSGKKK